MSAECGKCGADLVYPAGSWPIGECPSCSASDEVAVLRAQLAETQQERDDLQVALVAARDEVAALHERKPHAYDEALGHDGYECDPDCDACFFARESSDLRASLAATTKALEELANEAASACCEPRRFHENEDSRQQMLSVKVVAARAALSAAGAAPAGETDWPQTARDLLSDSPDRVARHLPEHLRPPAPAVVCLTPDQADERVRCPECRQEGRRDLLVGACDDQSTCPLGGRAQQETER